MGQSGDDLLLALDETADVLDGGSRRDRAARDPDDDVMDVEVVVTG